VPARIPDLPVHHNIPGNLADFVLMTAEHFGRKLKICPMPTCEKDHAAVRIAREQKASRLGRTAILDVAQTWLRKPDPDSHFTHNGILAQRSI
jgi:hypothetical protein